jgi:hypothetical protein
VANGIKVNWSFVGRFVQHLLASQWLFTTMPQTTEYLVCGTTFSNCGTCIDVHLEWGDIVNCDFVGYTTVAVMSTNRRSMNFM